MHCVSTKGDELTRYRQRLQMCLSMETPEEQRATEPTHEKYIVTPDEFVVAVLGLPASLTAERMFSGIYGLVQPPLARSFQTDDAATITFYLPDTSRLAPRFYWRNRLVSSWFPLCKVGINYDGKLSFSAKGVVYLGGPSYERYKICLARAADAAFRTRSDMAMHLAMDILSDVGSYDGTISRVLEPFVGPDYEGELDCHPYRVAFEEAWRVRDPKLAFNVQLYPFVDTEEEYLIKEFGMVGVQVWPHVRSILRKSGAFPDMKRSALLLAPVDSCKDDILGYDRFAQGLAALLPEHLTFDISLRRCRHATLKAIWDSRSWTVVARIPEACDEHGAESRCTCWIGPYLHHVAQDFHSARSKQTYNDLLLDSNHGRLSPTPVYRAYMQCIDRSAQRKALTQRGTDSEPCPTILRFGP